MTIYESMLAGYNGSGTATPNAEQEICQKIALAGLKRGGFFDHAAFYGGTCLRMFHGLPRFSEDMDFSLTEKRNDIPLDFNHLQARIQEFSGEDVSREQFMEQLRNKLATTDINNVKQDVLPYIGLQQRPGLDIWTNDYFLQLADMIKFQQ